MRIKLSTIFSVALILLLSFFVRNVDLHFPFWVDEFSTADQAKILLEHSFYPFTQDSYYFESHNLTTHYLVALSFLVFGVSEFAARLPILIVGILIPAVIFLVSKKLYGTAVAWAAAIFSIFSYFQITWSLQARGYALQQFFVLLVIYLYNKLLHRSKSVAIKDVVALMVVSVLGILTHTSFVLVIMAVAIHFIAFSGKNLRTTLKNPLLYLAGVGILSFSFMSGQLQAVFTFLSTYITNLPNNVGYYHSFLWREQTVVVFSAVLGVVLTVKNRQWLQQNTFLAYVIGLYIGFFSFIFPPYVSRYLLPIFPLLLIFAGQATAEIAQLISKKHAVLVACAIALSVVINGDTFTFRPKPFYSVNHDMREIALIDYDAVYERVLSKGALDAGMTAVIDTWPDRSRWYLDSNKEFMYAFRWLNDAGTVNGLPKYTEYQLTEQNEKYIPNRGEPKLKLIGELSDLEMAMSRYPYGFIWIDDQSLPSDVREYVVDNFYTEMYLESYPGDDNPYSIWPAALYSWGFETSNPYYE